MEHISKDLGRLDRGIHTPNQKIPSVEYEIPYLDPRFQEPTLEGKREELRKALGLSSLENTFENFKSVKGTEKTLAAFKEMAEGTTDKRLLLCYGGVGNGKTHLCEATAITLYKRRIFCCVLTMPRIMRWLKRGMRPREIPPYENRLDDFCSRDYLIVDDVGMGGSGSVWEYGQLEEIAVERYRERLFTILTTNRDLTELPERIVSRFRDGEISMLVLNEGEDYRRLK